MVKRKKSYNYLLSLRKKYLKKYKIDINPIPPSQKNVYKVEPQIFDQSRIFFKIHPRPHYFPFCREYDYHKYCLSKVKVDGLWVEFGSFNGVSARYLTTMKEGMFPDIKTLFHGFDSFEGLPEDWEGTSTKKGALSSFKSIPKISGAKFHKGWFKDTIPKFLKNYRKPFSFVHIDSDIYSSAVDIFVLAKDRFVPGTVILFDEIIGYDAWKLHEFKAFKEFVEKNNIEYEWIAAVANAGQAACIIK